MNILLVEDYQDLLHAIAESLERLEHRVTGLRTAEEVDAVLARQRTDLALVDLNLPREDGLSLIKRLRQAHPEMGIIVISARNTTLDRVNGYQSGADIYLTKPVANEELVAAIDGLARRLRPSPRLNGVMEDRTIDLNSHTLELNGPQGSARLTTTEFTLLSGLAQANEGRLETPQIYQLLGRSEGKKSALEALIYRVRRKLAETGAGDNCIRAHRLKGYQLFCSVRLL